MARLAPSVHRASLAGRGHRPGVNHRTQRAAGYRLGTGWDRKTAAAIRRALAPLAQPTCPLATPIKRADTIWVEPRYEADVVYVEIASDGMIRHPAFKGLALAAEPARLGSD